MTMLISLLTILFLRLDPSLRNRSDDRCQQLRQDWFGAEGIEQDKLGCDEVSLALIFLFC